MFHAAPRGGIDPIKVASRNRPSAAGADPRTSKLDFVNREESGIMIVTRRARRTFKPGLDSLETKALLSLAVTGTSQSLDLGQSVAVPVATFETSQLTETAKDNAAGESATADVTPSTMAITNEKTYPPTDIKEGTPITNVLVGTFTVTGQGQAALSFTAENIIPDLSNATAVVKYAGKGNYQVFMSGSSEIARPTVSATVIVDSGDLKANF